jgi:putative hemolysin
MSTQGVLRLMRVNNQHSQEVTEEEITASLAEGVSAGLIEAHEHQMVRNVFHLDDRPLTSMMTPHTDIVWLEASLTPRQALARIHALAPHEQHSWFPVCRDGLTHVLGVIGLTQLLTLPQGEERPIEHFVRQADFVPETQSGMELLERLRDQSSRVVFVVDEYGEVQGLVTPLDLLQAITGELKPETQTEAWATLREDGSWLLDGLMPVSELKARLGLDDLPAEDKGRYNTLAGLLLLLLGRLPQTAEKVRLGHWEFEIVDLDGRRIDKVLAVSLAPKTSGD